MEPTTGDAGLFGPGSVAWRVHANPVMLVGGIRALMIQALHPVAMAAVAQHSGFAEDVWGRLRRTAEFITDTTYGDTATATSAAARVRAVHDRITGTDPFTGRTYSAHDPDLLLWIHNVEVHSFLYSHRRYVGGISAEDADRYVAEMAVAGELVGIPPGQAPTSMAELRQYLWSAPMVLTQPAVDALAFLRDPPLGDGQHPLRPVWQLPMAGAIAILPSRVRAIYGLPWTPVVNPVVRLGVGAAFAALGRALPPPPAVVEARRRTGLAD
jgi:uncharacterized protein (DUF2236 family)